VLLATVLEFIHSATLIHDDIIDEATTRRGNDSVNHRFGNELSVLFGDYLFAKAMEMALAADNLAVMRRLADTTLRMTEGEMLQTRYVGRLDLSVAEYLDLVERKTAALFSCCCELAGVLGDPTRHTVLRATARPRDGVPARRRPARLHADATLGKPARDLREEGDVRGPAVARLPAGVPSAATARLAVWRGKRADRHTELL
jgi:hypothetical protein